MEPHCVPGILLLAESFAPKAGRDSASLPPMTMAQNSAVSDLKASGDLPQPVPAWGAGRALCFLKEPYLSPPLPTLKPCLRPGPERRGQSMEFPAGKRMKRFLRAAHGATPKHTSAFV